MLEGTYRSCKRPKVKDRQYENSHGRMAAQLCHSGMRMDGKAARPDGGMISRLQHRRGQCLLYASSCPNYRRLPRCHAAKLHGNTR
jgi:hypothetical protein